MQERIDFIYIYIYIEREREREREREITFYGRDVENKMKIRKRVKIKNIVMTQTPNIQAMLYNKITLCSYTLLLYTIR